MSEYGISTFAHPDGESREWRIGSKSFVEREVKVAVGQAMEMEGGNRWTRPSFPFEEGAISAQKTKKMDSTGEKTIEDPLQKFDVRG